ncbi:hypothetical protein K7432_018070 [Basidiobolus ranarum]|uniref:Uncharacterized protein n=1 Tax=Basidiobolus ranarum TaxID=34480 RepID=A0ABR2VJI1_9FUNG
MAHMELVDPAPCKSKFNPFYKGDLVDYDMSAPLNDGWMLSVPQPQTQLQPEPKQSSSKCEIKCLGGPDYQICGNGGATPFRMKCSPGTNCHIVDGQAGCF